MFLKVKHYHNQVSTNIKKKPLIDFKISLIFYRLDFNILKSVKKLTLI